MQNSKLWPLFQHLDAGAWRELVKMADSPYFNTRADVRQLCRYLQRCAPSGKSLTREAVYEAVYGGEPYEAPRLRTLLHALAELVRRYLVEQELIAAPDQYRHLLARALFRRDLPERAQEVLVQAEQALHGRDGRDGDWYERRFQLQADQLRNRAGDARSRQLNLQELSDHLECSFVLKKLKLACELLSHQAVYRTDYEFGLLEPVLRYVEERHWIDDHPAVALYYHCCRALMRPDEEGHFERLYPLLLESGTVFTGAECRDLFLLAINYCIRKVNQGAGSYAQFGLDLYQHALERGYLLENDRLSRFTFRNAVGMGLKIQAYDWVHSFIETYGPYIPIEHREAMVRFSRARLAYHRGRLDEAMELLSQADFDDVLLYLAAKTLLLKICYEAGEWRLLESSVDALDIYLRRKKIIGYHRDNYRQIVRTFRKLMGLNRFDPTAVQRFRTAIEADARLTERDWFLEQL